MTTPRKTAPIRRLLSALAETVNRSSQAYVRIAWDRPWLRDAKG